MVLKAAAGARYGIERRGVGAPRISPSAISAVVGSAKIIACAAFAPELYQAAYGWRELHWRAAAKIVTSCASLRKSTLHGIVAEMCAIGARAHCKNSSSLRAWRKHGAARAGAPAAALAREAPFAMSRRRRRSTATRHYNRHLTLLQYLRELSSTSMTRYIIGWLARGLISHSQSSHSSASSVLTPRASRARRRAPREANPSARRRLAAGASGASCVEISRQRSRRLKKLTARF